MSVLYGCHTFVPWLVGECQVAAGRRIINVASSFAFLCPPGMAPYNLSKAGVVALSETLHGELKPRGVGVTVVCPGPMPTRFIESASFDSPTFRRLTESYVRESTLDPAAVAAAALDAASGGNSMSCWAPTSAGTGGSNAGCPSRSSTASPAASAKTWLRNHDRRLTH